MQIQSCRRFLAKAAFAGAAGFGGFGAWSKVPAAEPPPEITTIRFERDGTTCLAPQGFEELLRAEGGTRASLCPNIGEAAIPPSPTART